MLAPADRSERAEDVETREAGRSRSLVGTIALAAAVIAALAITILLLGIAFDIEGAEEGEETSGWRAIFDIAWFSWLLGSLVALVAGALAYFSGRRRGDPGTTRAGTIALVVFVISVVIFIIAAAGD